MTIYEAVEIATAIYELDKLDASAVEAIRIVVSDRARLAQRIADIEAEVVRLMDTHVQAGRMLAADHMAELLGWLRATSWRKP